MPLVRISSSRWLWAAPAAPSSLPFLSYYSSWHSRQSGYLSLRSLRLPFLWLLIVRHVPSKQRLAQLRLPLP